MTTTTFTALTASFLLAFGFSACSNSNAGSQDQALTAAVQKNLNADPSLQARNIGVSTTNGVVTLTGNVASEAARLQAAQDAAVKGVSQVDNQIATDAAVAPANGAAAMADSSPTPASAMTSAARRPSNRSTARSAGSASPHLSAATPVQIESGTRLHVRLTRSLNSASASVGEGFDATLAEPVLVNGQIAIPKGARVVGVVADVTSAGHFKGQSRLALKLIQVNYNGQSYQVTTDTLARQASSRSTRSAETIGGGAAVGALIGALAGHGKGAAIGAITGAGAGTAAQALTKPAEVDLPAETALSFTLSSSVQVVPAAANR